MKKIINEDLGERILYNTCSTDGLTQGKVHEAFVREISPNRELVLLENVLSCAFRWELIKRVRVRERMPHMPEVERRFQLTDCTEFNSTAAGKTFYHKGVRFRRITGNLVCSANAMWLFDPRHNTLELEYRFHPCQGCLRE